MDLSAPLNYDDRIPCRLINDSLHHEDIPIYSYMVPFLDSPEVQRLRGIQQLGVTSFVWPSATHSRFVHSLGFAFWACKLLTRLQQRQSEVGITSRDVACVVIAGLCHDLGHGPWSHVWDDLFIGKILGKHKWFHEEGSEMMFDSLIRNNKIDMPIDDQQFVKALISGERSRTPNEKGFLFDIVANKTSGLDVDKFDYLCRNSAVLNLGSPALRCVSRLLESARVNLQKDHITYAEKQEMTVFTLFSTRFDMHRTHYNHKTVRAIAYMMTDALFAADPAMKLIEAIKQTERYINLNDAIMYQIKASTNPELADSRAIFARIDKRNLYKEAGTRLLEWFDSERIQEYLTPERIVEAAALRARAISPEAMELASTLRPTDIIVDFSSRSFGKGPLNPIDFVLFYSSYNPDECHNAHPSENTTMLPKYFCGHRVVVYVKKAKYVEVVNAGYRDLEQKLFGDNGVESGASKDLLVTTPPTTDRV